MLDISYFILLYSFEERDPRLRNRRSRSRERRGRNRSQSREADNNRFRGRRSRSNSRSRRNWSPPKKKGPVSPPPIQQQQPPPMQPNFNMAPPGMYDDRGYNNYQNDMNYGQNNVYSPYNYPPVMPVGQTFPSYPPPPTMQPVPPGKIIQYLTEKVYSNDFLLMFQVMISNNKFYGIFHQRKWCHQHKWYRHQWPYHHQTNNKFPNRHPSLCSQYNISNNLKVLKKNKKERVSSNNSLKVIVIIFLFLISHIFCDVLLSLIYLN